MEQWQKEEELRVAAIEGDAEEVQALLSSGVDVDAQWTFDQRTSIVSAVEGDTALHFAGRGVLR